MTVSPRASFAFVGAALVGTLGAQSIPPQLTVNSAPGINGPAEVIYRKTPGMYAGTSSNFILNGTGQPSITNPLDVVIPVRASTGSIGFTVAEDLGAARPSGCPAAHADFLAATGPVDGPATSSLGDFHIRLEASAPSLQSSGTYTACIVAAPSQSGVTVNSDLVITIVVGPSFTASATALLFPFPASSPGNSQRTVQLFANGISGAFTALPFASDLTIPAAGLPSSVSIQFPTSGTLTAGAPTVFPVTVGGVSGLAPGIYDTGVLVSATLAGQIYQQLINVEVVVGTGFQIVDRVSGNVLGGTHEPKLQLNVTANTSQSIDLGIASLGQADASGGVRFQAALTGLPNWITLGASNGETTASGTSLTLTAAPPGNTSPQQFTGQLTISSTDANFPAPALSTVVTVNVTGSRSAVLIPAFAGALFNANGSLPGVIFNSDQGANLSGGIFATLTNGQPNLGNPITCTFQGGSVCVDPITALPVSEDFSIGATDGSFAISSATFESAQGNWAQVLVTSPVASANSSPMTLAAFQVVLTSNSASLPVGQHLGTAIVVLQDVSGQKSPITLNIPVILNAGLPPPTITPSAVPPFSLAVGNLNTVPASASLALQITRMPAGLRAAFFTATPITSGWPSGTSIQLSSTTGVVTDKFPATPQTMITIGNPSRLTISGSPYQGTIRIDAPGFNSFDIALTVDIFRNPITIDPTSASFNLIVGQASAAPATVTVVVTSAGSYDVTSSPWIVVNPPFTTGPTSTHTISINPALAPTNPGTHSGGIYFGPDPDAFFSVTLVVSASGPPPTCGFSFSQLSPISFGPNGSTIMGFYPSTSLLIEVVPASSCAPNVTYTIASDSPWLRVTPAQDLGFNLVVFSNTQTTSRTGNIIVTATSTTGTQPPPATFVVTEAPSTGMTPLQRQVQALYQRLLGREPDYNGFTFWTNQGAAALGQMADSFLTSPEAQSSDFEVLAIFQAAQGHLPSYADYSNALNAIRASSLTPQQLLANLFGTNNNSPAITSLIYLGLLNRPPTSAELSAAAGQNPFAVFQNLFGSLEFRNGSGYTAADHSNALFVRMLYDVILQRDADPAGFSFWLATANSVVPGIYYNSVFGRLLLEGNGAPGEGFIGSPEFQGLFQ
ncbi:MAG TPA: DUF4214 domain-containing protein [Bryobacteraceae bacterium]|nr:DUF4214 domain-containing protein [Bryobacteraceae bacterium]